MRAHTHTHNHTSISLDSILGLFLASFCDISKDLTTFRFLMTDGAGAAQGGEAWIFWPGWGTALEWSCAWIFYNLRVLCCATPGLERCCCVSPQSDHGAQKLELLGFSGVNQLRHRKLREWNRRQESTCAPPILTLWGGSGMGRTSLRRRQDEFPKQGIDWKARA